MEPLRPPQEVRKGETKTNVERKIDYRTCTQKVDEPESEGKAGLAIYPSDGLKTILREGGAPGAARRADNIPSEEQGRSTHANHKIKGGRGLKIIEFSGAWP